MTESLRRFIEGLDRAKPYLTTEQQTLAPGVKDIADMLWLAAEIAAHTPPAEMETVETAAVEEPLATKSPDSIPQTPEVTSTSPSTVTPPPNTESLGILSTQPPAPPPQSEESPESRETTPPLPQKVDRLKVPAAAALRHPLRLIRALRPLARKVDSRTEKIIDEEATAIAMAEKNPIGVVQQPAQERWLSLELVIEQSRITALWDRTSKEWADLLSGSGLFRSVRVWTLGRSEQPDSEQSISEETCICLASGLPSSPPSRWATPKELLDPSGQSLVMVLSDCVSPRWWQGQIQPVLAEWSSQGPVVVVQWFPPEPYWNRTALKLGYDLKLKALAPGLPNSLLLREYQGLNPEMGLDLLEEEPTKAVILPIVSLEPHQLGQWSRMVAGYSDAQVTGRRFDLIWQGEQWQGPRKPPRNLPSSGQERVKLFWQTASVLAQELAGLMSLGPVSPEITNLIQETLLPQSSPVHVAEVFLSGLLEPTAQGSYAFVPEAKDKLQTSMIEADEQLVFQVLSRYVSERYGRTPREFEVFLQKHSDWSEQEWQQVEGFAELRQRFSAPPTPEDPPIQQPTASGTPSADDDPFSVTGQISDEPLRESLDENFSVTDFEPYEITYGEWEGDPEPSDDIPSLIPEEIEFSVAQLVEEPEESLEQLESSTPEISRSQQLRLDLLEQELEQLEKHYNEIVEEIQIDFDPETRHINLPLELGDELEYLIKQMESIDLEIISLSPQSESSTPKISRSQQLRIDLFQHVLKQLEENYQDISEEIQTDFDPETRSSLEEELKHLEQQMESINVEITSLSPQSTSSSQWQQLRLENIAPTDQRPEPPPGTTLISFNYTVVTLNPDGSEKERYIDSTTGYIETLAENINLEMIAIPGGEFLMGAPETEEDSRDYERPQHRVKVPSFYMGRYPVTQAQWRIVASWEQVNQNLNPDPSGFKSDNLPVEQVSWNDAQEFCARLRQRFQREYCLPSEAQWEYACRARTTTPFHFGETLNTDVANYNGNYTYRKTTTAVVSLGAANAWGLCDMHGNVWEWCQDDWHGNYEGAPDDGSAWVDKNNSTSVKVRRGGSWYEYLSDCRSASRRSYSRGYGSYIVGFRVACPSPRALAL